MTSKKVVSAGDKRMFFFSLAVFIGTLVLVGSSLISRQNAGVPAGQPSGLEPVQPIAPLSEAFNDQIRAIAAQVDACPDYSDERRVQMQQHINWLYAPDTIPDDIRLAIGANPIGRLLFGMGSYTAIDWRARGKAADSCLLSIGQALNRMIAEQGETPFDEFAV